MNAKIRPTAAIDPAQVRHGFDVAIEDCAGGAIDSVDAALKAVEMIRVELDHLADSLRDLRTFAERERRFKA